MLSRKLFIVLVVFIVAYFSSCDKNKNNGSNSNIEIVRFDKLLFGLDTNKISTQFEKLRDSHKEFTDIYFEKIVPIPGYKDLDSTFYKELKFFITDSLMRDLVKLVDDEFGDMGDIKNQFDITFKNSKKIFKSNSNPKLYSFISGFAYQKFIFDVNDRVGLAFGLDFFLGDKFPYKRLERGQNTFSDYFVRTYNKDHLVRNVLDMWVDDELGIPNGNRAIDFMIKNGKKLFIIKELLPNIQDTILLQYSEEQLNWVENNEKEMWTYFIKKDFFYTTDNYKIKRLTSFSPNSQALGMPIKSPGFTGNYLGYRIVQTYMKRDVEKSIEGLIENQNAQKILEQSRFKPKRK